MSKIWNPPARHREPLPACNILELLDGSRLESGNQREVRAFVAGAGSCWVARFDGPDDAWMSRRTFMKEWSISQREVDGVWLREHVFVCEQDGFYEARSWMRAEGEREAGYHTIYFSLSRERGFELCEPSQFHEANVASYGVDFGDVRSLIAAGEYELAGRAANWLPGAQRRQEARSYVEIARADRERRLPSLIGDEPALSTALEVRARARRALDVHLANIASNADDASREIFEQARGWLLEKTMANFWLEHREQLSQGAWIWERFLSEITE